MVAGLHESERNPSSWVSWNLGRMQGQIRKHNPLAHNRNKCNVYLYYCNYHALIGEEAGEGG